MRALDTHPLLKHHQAEQQFVIVLLSGAMVVEQCLDRPGFEQIEHQRVLAQQHLRQRAFQGRMEPAVDDVDREAALLAFENLRRAGTAGTPAGAATCPCRRGSSCPRRGAGRTRRRFDPGMARAPPGRAPSRACRRTSAVRPGSDDRISRSWKPASSSRCSICGQQRRPVLDAVTDVPGGQTAIAEQAADRLGRRQRKHVLVALAAGPRSRASTRRAWRFVPRQPVARRSRSTWRTGTRQACATSSP